MTNETHTIVLIDGDILVYRAGFASEDQPWGICRSRVDSMIVDIMDNCGADTIMGFLTDGKDNFRNKVAVTLPYKGNRSAPKPVHYDAIREYLMDKHGFEMHYTQEADDAIGITHTELTDWDIRKEANPKVVIASIDKDLMMIPGWHYNIKHKEVFYVNVQKAYRNLYLSILTGDRTDNIPGLKGWGPVKANKLLPVGGSIQDLHALVWVTYRDSGHTFTYFMEQLELLFIRRIAYSDTHSFFTTDVFEPYSTYRED